MMIFQELNTMGLKCPHPLLKIAVKAAYMKRGEVLEVLGDCPTFEEDIRSYCKRLHKPLLSVRNEEESRTRVQIQF